MRIKISPVFAVYVLCIGIMTSWLKCFCALTALAVHEAAHYAAARICREKISKIMIAPFGGVMEYSEAHAPRKGLSGICIAAAGPAANYLMIHMVGILNTSISPEWKQEFIIANLSLLLVNMLPVMPLDGGRIVLNLLYFFAGIGLLSSILSWMGAVVGGTLIAIGIYGFAAKRIVNVSLFIVGGYLMVFAIRSRESMLAENRYAVLQERQERRRNSSARIRCVYPDTGIVDVVRWLGGKDYVLFLYNGAGETPILLTEQWVIKKMLSDPGKCFGDICKKDLPLDDKEIILK